MKQNLRTMEYWEALRKSFLFDCMTHYFPHPVTFSKGEGCYLEDIQGNRYLDFFCGILVTSLGHCHPKVTEAVCEQLKTLQHTSTVYSNIPMLELAERLAFVTPGKLKKCFFVNSGSEAIEVAVHVAREFTGGVEIIALGHGYHGHTGVAMCLTGQRKWRGGQSGVVAGFGIKHVSPPYCYRCKFRQKYPSCNLLCIKELEEVIETSTSGKIAAVIMEPIMGVGGVIIPPSEYFPRVKDIIHKHGGLFIVDEVQTGIGHTGRMFGIEHWGVDPDIMVIGKALGNGLPIGVTITLEEIAQEFKVAKISTFGGNPVACRAGVTVLEVLEKEGLIEKVALLEGYLGERLNELAAKYPQYIGEVRGKGFMWGIEIVRDGIPAADLAEKIVNMSREYGLLIGRSGLYGNILRIAPPLIASKNEIEEGNNILSRVLEKAFLNH